MKKANIFFKLTKVDEAKRLVSGIATAELPDQTNEVCDYETTKPYYEKWSGNAAKATGGKSLGNLRAMHQSIAAGKLTAIDFDDVNKTISITAKVVDDDCWKKVLEGVFFGFSQGGEYIKRWKDGEFMRYTADPHEVSLVDNPCLSEATFEVVKADGTSEMHKFIEPAKGGKNMLPKQKWTTTDGKSFDKKAEAIEHQGTLDADQFVKSVTDRVKAVVDGVHTELEKREFSDEKRKELADKGHAMPDGSFPIEDEHDLENAIHAIGRAKDPEKAKAHIIARAKDLGASDKIPAEWHGKEDDHEKIKKAREAISKLTKSETWDCVMALDALMQIECLLSGEMWESEEGDDESASQVADLKMCIERLKSFIASEIAEGTREDGSLAMAARGGLTKAEHMEHVHEIHKAASHVMTNCMKAMGAMHEEGEEAEKVKKGMEEAHDHMHAAHKKAAGIMNRCMKMGSKFEPEDDGEDHDDADDGVKKMLKKALAERDGVTKLVGELTTTLEAVQKRLALLEAQPAPRKGSAMVVEKTLLDKGHEPVKQDQAVETQITLPNGMSPADIRHFMTR